MQSKLDDLHTQLQQTAGFVGFRGTRHGGDYLEMHLKPKWTVGHTWLPCAKLLKVLQ